MLKGVSSAWKTSDQRSRWTMDIDSKHTLKCHKNRDFAMHACTCNLHKYIYIYMCVCMCVRRYKYAFRYIYIYVCMYVCMDVCMYVCSYRYKYTSRYRHRYTFDIPLFNSTSVYCRNTVYTSNNYPYLWMFVNQTLWLPRLPHILSPPGPTCSAPIAPCCCRLHCRDSGDCVATRTEKRPRATVGSRVMTGSSATEKHLQIPGGYECKVKFMDYLILLKLNCLWWFSHLADCPLSLLVGRSLTHQNPGNPSSKK